MTKERGNLVEVTCQSKPVDTSEPYDPTWVAGKTILITGGSSGFGEGFFRKWAENGASVIIGDVNSTRGRTLVEEVRKSTGNANLHFLYCDVADWQSQVDFFHSAAKLSPNGGIDAVVANAGISENNFEYFQSPKGLDADEPPVPDFKCLDINLRGVMYTTHLALFYLPKNPNSNNLSSSRIPAPNTPDRHLLLIGSVASLQPLPGQVQYCVSKHGVLGLFRSLRATSSVSGIRVNALLPYYIDTPLIPIQGRLLLAGSAVGKPEDVVDAGTRLMADSRIIGRALVVGPKVRLDDNGSLLPPTSRSGNETAVWEAYAHDLEEVDAFNARFVRLVNNVERAKGWIGWAYDVVAAFTYPLRSR